MLIALTVLGVAELAAPAGAVLNSTVRVDQRSGRLVRSLQVQPRVVVPRTVPAIETSAREDRGRRELLPAKLSAARDEIRRIATESAARHDVDPDLVEAVIQVESNYNPGAVSPKGAMGLMQLIPATARRFGVENPFDARENIDGGVRYLKYLQGLYGDNRLALAAYNAGEGAVARFGWIPPYQETQAYVYEVGRRYGTMRRKRVTNVSTPPSGRRLTETLDAEGRLHIRYVTQP